MTHRSRLLAPLFGLFLALTAAPTLGQSGDDADLGTLTIFMYAEPDGAVVEASFRDPRDGSELTVTADESVSIDGIEPGEYEVVLNGHTEGFAVRAVACREAPGWQYSYPIDERTLPADVRAGAETICLFEAAGPGTAVVFVVTDPPGASGTFVFSDPRDPAGATTASIAAEARLEFEGLAPGQHTVALVDATPGFDAAAWTCMPPVLGRSGPLDAETMLFDIDTDDDVVCLYGAGAPGSIGVALEADPPGAEAEFAVFDLTDAILGVTDPETDALARGTTDDQSWLSLEAVPPDLQLLQMVELTDGYALHSIGCRLPDGDETEEVDVDEQWVVLRVDPAASIACIFRVRASLPSGGASSGGPTDSDTGDPSEPDEQEADEPADTSPDWIVPLAGRWKATNKVGTVACTGTEGGREGAIVQRIPRSTETGRIKVRDGGRTLIGTSLAQGQTAPLKLTWDSESERYKGSVRAAAPGGRTKIKFDFRVVNQNRLEGELIADVRVNAGGVKSNCTVGRAVSLKRQ